MDAKRGRTSNPSARFRSPADRPLGDGHAYPEAHLKCGPFNANPPRLDRGNERKKGRASKPSEDSEARPDRHQGAATPLDKAHFKYRP